MAVARQAGFANSRASPELDARIASATRRASRASARATAIGASSSRPTPPSRPNTCSSRHFRGEPPDLALEAKIAAYLRRIQGGHGGWPLFHDGAFDMSASVKAYFALKMIGEPIDAPHMRRAREAILSARRRGAQQRLHPFLLALYGEMPWRGGAGHAGRDHAPAALVPVPPRQGVLLGAHRAGAALRPAGAEAAGRRTRAASASPSSSSTPPDEVRAWPKGPHQKWPWAQIFGAIDAVLQSGRAALPERLAPARHRGGARLRRRAPERPRRPRRHLSGHGQRGADVRCARLSAGPPEPRRRAAVDRRAARRPGGRGLLPAVPVAGVGHGPRLSRAARGRRRGGGARRRGAASIG